MNEFMKDIKKDKVKITMSMVLFLLLVIGATYAIISSVFNYGSSGIGVNIGSRPIFMADTSDQINLDIPYIPSVSETEYVISADTASVNMSLSANYASHCSYDLYWVWDTSADEYVKTSGSEKEYTLTGLINNKEVFSETQLNDYGVNSNKTKLYTGTIATEGATITYQTLIINAEFWKTKAIQDTHTNKNYSGKLSVENVVCESGYGKNLSDTVLAKVSNNDYISSQDQTVYRVKKETAAFVASDATYTKVTNYGNTKIYSGTNETITSGTDATGKFVKATDGTWTSNGTLTNTYYHVVLPIEENGYYEVCYNLGTGNTNNALQAYVTDNANSTLGTNIFLGGEYNMAATANTPKSGCQYIGYLTTDKAVRIVNRAYTSIASVSFYLQKTNEEETKDAGVRYEGKDPDNYVQFNGNEEWRIIGVFEGSTIGLEPGKQYTKIIRNTPMYKAWDEYQNGAYENDWTNSTLNTYLNGEYLESLTDSDKIAQYNGNYSTWHLLGPTWSQSTIADANAWYFYERTKGTPGYKDDVKGAADATTTGAIGLMYPSDYGYGAYGTNCDKTNMALQIYKGGCASVDWLMLQDNKEWLISPNHGYSDYAFYVYDGNVYDYYVNNEWAARPALYLEADTSITEGNGSKEAPYIIGTSQYDTLSNTILSQESNLDYKSAQDRTPYIVKHETVEYNGTTYDAGVRYEGKDPDNYVQFNGNEEWRIIGVFEGSTIGLEPGKQYTKIIRNIPMYEMWDEDWGNDWISSTLNTYLNGEYLNSMTDSNKIAEYNGNYSTWYLRGTSSYEDGSYDSAKWYLAERITGSRAPYGETTTTEAIGLMYPSDYGYGAYGSACDNAPYNDLYNYESGCASMDWFLLENDYEWLISPRPVNSVSTFIVGGGNVTDGAVFEELAVRPVLYLEADVKVISGSGSKNNPYILK